MSSEQFRDAIEALGLSQREAGRFFGVDERLARRWATGEVPVPRYVEVVFTLMHEFQMSAEAVDSLLEEA